MGVDFHEMPRWLTTPLAASAASFQPSKAAITTGWSSGPSTSLNLMTLPPHHIFAPMPATYSLRRPPPGLRYLWYPQFWPEYLCDPSQINGLTSLTDRRLSSRAPSSPRSVNGAAVSVT